MKNLFKLFALLLCLLFSLPVFAEEKISNFEVHFNLNEDATATVKEYITFTAEHNKIMRGLYRVLPKDTSENIKIESLTLEGKKHPYDIEEGENFLKINFGTNDLLEEGEHTYVFTYSLDRVMETTLTHDALHWSVSGGYWPLPIEKSSFYLTIPYSLKPIANKIAAYIGEDKTKNFNQIEENVFIFESSKPLKEGESFSVYFPVKKGVFKFKWYEVKYMPVFVCLIIIIYYFIIWCLVGRDPDKRNLATMFKPPHNISAGFVSYFLNGPFSSKNLATVFASLMIKKKIKVKFPKEFGERFSYTSSNSIELYNIELSNPLLDKFKFNIEVSKTSLDVHGLEEDEARLFLSLPIDFRFNSEGYKYLQKGLLVLNDYYREHKENYVINNFVYMFFPIVFFGMIIFYFYMQGVVSEVLFWGIINFLIPLAIGIYTRNILRIILLVSSVLLLNLIGISTLLSLNLLADPNVIAVIITCFVTAFFVHLVNNLTLDGAVLRDELAAFKRYMTIAEKHRVALSNPAAAGQIFCDYLPYAYAFGMESEWFDKFKNKIDFRLKDVYGPLISSTAFNVGLLFTISAVLQGGIVGKNIPIPLGKGGFGGGVR